MIVIIFKIKIMMIITKIKFKMNKFRLFLKNLIKKIWKKYIHKLKCKINKTNKNKNKY